MRILHIINNLGSGGAEKLIEETVPLLNQIDGLVVDVLLLTDKNNVFQESLVSKGIKVDVINLRKIYNPLNIIGIKRYIESGNYDIVHTHLFPTQYWVGFAKVLLNSKKIKFITTEHNNNNRRRGKAYFKLLDRYIYSKYDSVVCITDMVRTNLIGWINPKKQDLDKFIIIENGVNISKFKEAAAYLKTEINSSFTEDTRLLTMVSRFSEAKDQPTLIKAMQHLPENTQLLLVGEGPLREQCEQLAKETGVASRVHFLGFRNDIARILKTSDIIVLSSYWEGLSLASIEGMASGRPFIASEVEGLKDIVGGYGLLFERGNEDELSAIIRKILTHDDIYNEIASKCLERSETYNIKRMVDKTVKLYLNLLN